MALIAAHLNAGSSPWQEQREDFLLLAFCADCYFGVRSTPVTAVACKKCRWQFHVATAM